MAIGKGQAIAGGRNLVVLADGTGNSAAKSFKTNVWRLYQALDLTDGTQLAVFGDGVGTSSFKIMHYLGVGLGMGVKRNVLNLYKFLCLNYKEGDRLWAFGFSRGAFTVRLLVDLVFHEGLVSFLSEEELDRAAIAAYRVYRSRTFPTNLPWVWVVRSVRDLAVRLRNWAVGARQYSEIRADTYTNRRHMIDFHFVGVWDTVDAYGLPVHELTVAFDKWVWPMLFADKSLPPNVLTARQALSLDDERRTFSPIPWNEAEERWLREQYAPWLDPDRLFQVWFAGTHANVGGGYPDDSLSYVPLRWMIGEAALKKLKFQSSTLTIYTAIASPTGRLYDSRAGLGAFYRYQPRDVQDLMGPTIRPLVHYEVITRMAQGNDGYAPISLPHDFDVLPPYGARVAFDWIAQTSDPPRHIQNVPGRPPNYVGDQMEALVKNVVSLGQTAEKLTEVVSDNREKLIELVQGNREKLIEFVQDTVWWRRLSYFVSLALALVIAAYPLYYNSLYNGGIIGDLNAGSTGALGSVSSLAQRFFLQAIAAPWVTAFVESPVFFILFALALFLSLWWSGFLQRRIRDRARDAWGVRAIVDGRQLENSRLIEQRRASLIAAIASAALLSLALRLHSKTTFWVALGGVLLFSVIFFVRRVGRDPDLNKATRPSFLLSVAKIFRRPIAAVCYKRLEQQVFPFFFILIFVLVFFSAVYRGLLVSWSAWGKFCEPSASGTVTNVNDGRPFEMVADFSTSSICQATGLGLVKGVRYRITLTMKNQWFDNSVETDVGGFPSSIYPQLYFEVSLRRWLLGNWFEPVARIGAQGGYEYLLEPQSPIPDSSTGLHTHVLISDIQPKASRELFIYVNDAVLLWQTNFFYRNNKGSAKVKVEQIKADAIVD